MCSVWRRRDSGCAGRAHRDAQAIHRYSSKWEVAKFTARIPHPYPVGSAERFVYAAREANSLGRGLVLVIAPAVGPAARWSARSAGGHGSDHLALGYALAPEVWGRGYATEAVAAMVDAGFSLTAASRSTPTRRVENPASRRVLEKNGFAYAGPGPQGAPARGGLVDCDRFAHDPRSLACAARRRRAGPRAELAR